MSARHLSLAIRTAALTSGLVRQFGWLFTAGSLLFCALFLRSADLRLHHYDAVGEGVVRAVQRTSSSENDRDIFEVEIEFAPAGGAPRTIRSYSVEPPAEGARVEVDYDAADPEDACLRGGRAAPFGKWTLLFLLMPAVGLLFALFRTRQSARYLRLLRTGRQGAATLVGVKKEVSEDGESEAEVRLRFVDDQGRERFLVHHTFQPAALQDDAHEVIFYDAEDPSRAVALDYLPGRLELRGDRFVARGRLWIWLVAPLVTLAEVAALLAALFRG